MKQNTYFQVMGNVVLDEKQIKALWYCYYPLINQEGYILYTFLQANIDFRLDQITTMLQMSKERFKKAKENLEGYGLLDSYYNEKENSYILKIYPCLTIERFLRHDLLSRAFIKKQGKIQYDTLVEMINTMYNQEIPQGYVLKTQKITSIMKDWNQMDDLQYSTRKKIEVKSDFPINEFLADLSVMVFPTSQRTSENIDLICEMADFYNISIEKMRTFVGRSMERPKNTFNPELFKQICQQKDVGMKPVKQHPYDEYPIIYLSSKFNFLPLNRWEKDLLEKLRFKYGLNNEVINVISEYTINHCNNSYNTKYAEKVGTRLSRANINTYEEALKFLDDSNQQRNNHYQKVKVIKPTNDDDVQIEHEDISDEELLALQRSLRGDSDEAN